MRINFLVNPVFDGWEPDDVRLGGTERAVVEWALELTARGHRVGVWRNGRTEISEFKNGVFYGSREIFKKKLLPHADGDVTISIKSPEYHRKNGATEPVIYYTNETDAFKNDLSVLDAVIHISQFAKNNIPVNNENVFVVPHGYDPKMIYPGKKIPKQCLYASSPDRGLDDLLEAWPTVVAAHPEATLLVTYGGTGPALPGVTYLGEVDEEFMAELFRTSDIWTYPCNGGELFCITGIKAQAAGCIPVIIPTMALSETVKSGYFATKEHYATVLSDVLGFDYKFASNNRRGSAKGMPTIADSTDALLNVVEFVLDNKKSKNGKIKQSKSIRK